MKKGCFIKSIILLTIVTAALLYLINNKFNDFVFNPGKKLIANEIKNELKFVKASPEKDSLNILINKYIMNIKDVKHISEKEIDRFADSLKIALADSVIDQKEYKKLYGILNKKVN